MSLHLIRNKCVRLDVSLTTTTVHYHTYVIWDKLLLLPPSFPFTQLWINSWYSTVTAFCRVSSDCKTHIAAKAWHEMGALSAEDTSDKLETMVVGDCGGEVGVGLSTKGRDKGWDLCTSVFIFRVTSSSVQLVFLTALTCETWWNI